VAELEDLGTPPVFAEIVRVGYAVARLRLPTDATVPREVAATAAKVDQATMALQGAVDLAAELQDEGVRQPVSLIRPPGGEPDQERALIWARHAELQATVEELVGTSVGFPPPIGRVTEYEMVMTQAVQALGAMEEQRRLALGSCGPRLPEPTDPAPSPSPRAPTPRRGTDPRPHTHEAPSRNDGDRSPAAAIGAVGAGKAGRVGTRWERDASDAPTFDELERRIRTVRLDPIKLELLVGVASLPPDRVQAKARDL
jgi:hypothetical protein